MTHAELDAIEARFWSKVSRKGPNECWVWTGAVSYKGYGRFRSHGRLVNAHRVSWEMAAGKPMPTEMFACHACDNPPCVNPAHIWCGSQSDNARDAVSKGRAFGPRSRFIVEGGVLTVAEVARRSGMKPATLWRRLSRGESMESATIRPVMTFSEAGALGTAARNVAGR